MNELDVSIILVNYKTPYMTKDAIESVISKSSCFSYEIIVVDNSCDEEEYSLLDSIIGSASSEVAI